jgi:hypothetical protein
MSNVEEWRANFASTMDGNSYSSAIGMIPSFVTACLPV